MFDDHSVECRNRSDHIVCFDHFLLQNKFGLSIESLAKITQSIFRPIFAFETEHPSRRRFDSDSLLLASVISAVIFLDVEHLLESSTAAWGFRLWLLSIGALFYLLVIDWLSTPVVYKLPISNKFLEDRAKEKAASPNSLNWSFDVPLSQCEFSIIQAKLLFADDLMSEGTYNIEIGSLVQFQIITKYNYLRYYHWLHI